MNIEQIQNGKAILGIEFGSTRIKSVLIDSNHEVLASGSHEWENDYVDGIWTYSEEAIISGLQSSYADLIKDVFIPIFREAGGKFPRSCLTCLLFSEYNPNSDTTKRSLWRVKHGHCMKKNTDLLPDERRGELKTDATTGTITRQ